MIVVLPEQPRRDPRACDLPDDVWRIVATYLSLHQLSQHMSLNRTFFNVFLDTNYGEVRWTKLDRSFVRVLDRLQ